MTLMRSEIDQIPDVIEKILSDGAPHIRAAAESLKNADPDYLITVARGTSDHAALFFKYASELILRKPVVTIGPSVASIYGVELELRNAACVAISQSGASPDIISLTRSIGQQVPTVSITNNTASPLAEISAIPLDMLAGPEHAVAATKTFVASCVTLLCLLAEWSDDDALKSALSALPEAAQRAANIRWDSLLTSLSGQSGGYIVGRGPSYAIAHEAALKCKETCGIHTEAYSAAELLHGPSEIIKGDFPVLFLTASDCAELSTIQTAQIVAKRSRNIFVASNASMEGATCLNVERTPHSLTDSIVNAISYYAFVEELSLLVGLNPDKPSSLSKVTMTI